MRFILGTLLLLQSRSVTQALTGVITLDSRTFESITQAATGQTTGNWLVYFHQGDPQGPVVQALSSYSPDMAFDDTIFIAQVDCASSPELAKRFGDCTKGGQVLLFRNRKMYRFSGSTAPDGLVQRLLAFAETGWKIAPELDVPPVVNPLKDALLSAKEAAEQLLQKVTEQVQGLAHAHGVELGQDKVALAIGVASALLLTALFGVQRLWGRGTKTEKTE